MAVAALDPQDGVRKLVIIDLDGTLANIDHRTHHVKKDKPDWDAFNRECVNDKPNAWCVKLINELSRAYLVRLVIVSARSKVVEAETRDWLNNHVEAFVTADVELFMLREVGDNTEDVELKMRWLKENGGSGAVLFAVDDRQKVVDAWRAAGVVCLQAYAWPEFHKHVGRG
jgi:hypothetical protein